MTAPTRPGRLDAATAQRIADHERLIGWTVHRYATGWLDTAYTLEDAWQEGWLGLATAATTWHPDMDVSFPAYAVGQIRTAIRAGGRTAAGVNGRRAARTGTRVPHALRLDLYSLDSAHMVPSIDPGPEAQVLDTLALTAAVEAGRSAVSDYIDLHVLAWMLDLSDTRTAEDLAADLGAANHMVWRRRARIRSLMARAAHGPSPARLRPVTPRPRKV